jgi:hypothetical protein
MFVHDGSGSIFVKLAQGLIQSLPAGSLIDLRGVTEPGEFAPIVAKPEIHVIGFSGLPTNPARPSLASLSTGTRDGQLVEVEGVIHSVVEADHHIDLQLAMEDGNIPVLIGEGTVADYTGLIDAKVRIRGNAGRLFDSSRLQMIGANIQCPNFSAINVMEPAPADPLKLPIIPTSRLLQLDVAPLLAHRVHVQGQVSLQWPDTTVCIRDGLKGICAQTRFRKGDASRYKSSPGSRHSFAMPRIFTRMPRGRIGCSADVARCRSQEKLRPEALAQRDSRTMSELFCEAFRTYSAQQARRTLDEPGEHAAGP